MSVCDTCETTHRAQTRRRFIQTGGTGVLMLLGAGTLSPARAADEATPETGHLPHWTYEGEEGPEHWGELDPAYATCSGGTKQSPIDVTGATEGDLANIEFDYHVVSPLHILNNGHTAQVTVPEGSSITLEGTTYPLKQFHFHAPSEHTIDGVADAMELHLVHITDDGAIAVVGVLLTESEENAALKSVFEAMPAMAGPEQEVIGSVDLYALLPSQLTSYRYSGSLTTPPCSEGVQWLLMTERQSVSAAQVGAFRKVFITDARPVQPLNDREIGEDTTG
jgi:carbonic anhydrase